MDGLKYSDSFKVVVSIEVLREKESLTRIATKYKLEPFLIKRWKIEFIDLVETVLKSKNLEINHLKHQLNYQSSQHLRYNISKLEF